MALLSAQYKNKPIPWMYSFMGAMLFTAVLKLHPFHRGMRKLEKKNIQEYFASFAPNQYRKTLSQFQASLMCYFSSIQRVVKLNSKARQDYFALNRFGCFSAKEIPLLETSKNLSQSDNPVLIVPGLNTPAVFFKEMHQYFTEKGFPVSVLHLPNRGLADISTASEALADEVKRMQDCCQTESINVIGHCLGGLIGQYYLANHVQSQDKSPIKNLITLGTGFMGADGVQNLKEKWAAGHPTQAIPKVFDELIEWNMNIAVKAGEVAYHNFVTIWDFIIYFQKGLLNLDQELGVDVRLNWQHWNDAISDPSHPMSKMMALSNQLTGQLTDSVRNYIIDDADIDHITLALNKKMFQKIEAALISRP